MKASASQENIQEPFVKVFPDKEIENKSIKEEEETDLKR